MTDEELDQLRYTVALAFPDNVQKDYMAGLPTGWVQGGMPSQLFIPRAHSIAISDMGAIGYVDPAGRRFIEPPEVTEATLGARVKQADGSYKYYRMKLKTGRDASEGKDAYEWAVSSKQLFIYTRKDRSGSLMWPGASSRFNPAFLDMIMTKTPRVLAPIPYAQYIWIGGERTALPLFEDGHTTKPLNGDSTASNYIAGACLKGPYLYYITMDGVYRYSSPPLKYELIAAFPPHLLIGECEFNNAELEAIGIYKNELNFGLDKISPTSAEMGTYKVVLYLEDPEAEDKNLLAARIEVHSCIEASFSGSLPKRTGSFGGSLAPIVGQDNTPVLCGSWNGGEYPVKVGYTAQGAEYLYYGTFENFSNNNGEVHIKYVVGSGAPVYISGLVDFQMDYEEGVDTKTSAANGSGLGAPTKGGTAVFSSTASRVAGRASYTASSTTTYTTVPYPFVNSTTYAWVQASHSSSASGFIVGHDWKTAAYVEGWPESAQLKDTSYISPLYEFPVGSLVRTADTEVVKYSPPKATGSDSNGSSYTYSPHCFYITNAGSKLWWVGPAGCIKENASMQFQTLMHFIPGQAAGGWYGDFTQRRGWGSFYKDEYKSRRGGEWVSSRPGIVGGYVSTNGRAQITVSNAWGFYPVCAGFEIEDEFLGYWATTELSSADKASNSTYGLIEEGSISHSKFPDMPFLNGRYLVRSDVQPRSVLMDVYIGYIDENQ